MRGRVGGRPGLAIWQTQKPIALLPRNVLIWEGPSQLTGDPIFVLASAKTRNRKIGAMVQLWILPELNPLEAVKTGRDEAICGDCTHRGDGTGKQRSCYVVLRGPQTIHRHRHHADRMDPEAFARMAAGKQLRIGAYGDPVAVPLDVWRPLLQTAGGWTAYTHQWQTAPAGFQAWCMASVDSVAQQQEAAALGWRTFRVRSWAEKVLKTEVTCPASEEAGHKAVCAECSLCRGAARPAKHIVLAVHGSGMKWFGTSRPTRPVGLPFGV